MKALKRKHLIILSGLCILILAAGISVFCVIKDGSGEDSQMTPPMMNDMGEDIVSASGLTTVGMLEETWELDFLETALYVEESYLVAGDEVEAGTAVFKVSGETIDQARKELEAAVTEAELNYRQGVINYETEAIEARVTGETAAVNKKYSQAEYDSAAAQAAKKVEELENQVEEARELAQEYEKSVNEDYYRTYYQVDELYQTYYEHFTLLMETYEKWDIKEKESLYGNSASDLGSSSGSGTSGAGVSQESSFEGMQEAAGGGSYDENSSLLSVYNLLDEMVQEEAEKYKTALENYETAKRKAQAGLSQAQSNLASLEAELAVAQTEYEKQLILCKADYETTLAQSDNAQAVYETTLESLEETLAALEDEKEEAEENLALFEDVIGDGYFYTQSAGTIVMNGVRAGTYMSGESLVVAYSNPETVSVSASVDQSDIAKIAIGDSVYVAVSEYGNYQGRVTVINPVTQAQSRSLVTYQVTVTLEGDVSTLDSNLTAYVYFGVTEEMIQQMKGTSGPDGATQKDGRMEAGSDRQEGEAR